MQVLREEGDTNTHRISLIVVKNPCFETKHDQSIGYLFGGLYVRKTRAQKVWILNPASQDNDLANSYACVSVCIF